MVVKVSVVESLILSKYLTIKLGRVSANFKRICIVPDAHTGSVRYSQRTGTLDSKACGKDLFFKKLNFVTILYKPLVSYSPRKRITEVKPIFPGNHISLRERPILEFAL